MSSNNHSAITHNLHKLVVAMDTMADDILREKLDLSFSSFRILSAINCETVCQRDIAEYWDMTEAAVSRQIDILVEKKLLIREENKENRRQYKLVVTTDGKKKLKKAVELIDTQYEHVYKQLSKREQEYFADMLQEMLTTFKKKQESRHVN